MQADSPKPYANFDIHIGPAHNGRYPLSVIHSPAGETQTPVWQALPQAEAFADSITYLRDLLARPSDAEALGGLLHNFLFPPSIQILYDHSLASNAIMRYTRYCFFLKTHYFVPFSQ